MALCQLPPSRVPAMSSTMMFRISVSVAILILFLACAVYYMSSI